jgi:Uncharacterised nucleotidyltransferase
MTAMLDELVVAVTATGLPGSVRELPRHELSEQEAHELVTAAERLGITGLMAAAVRAGGLRLPPGAVGEFREAHLREATTGLYLEQELLSLTALLGEGGIESRVLDGSAVAHLDYRDPTLRAVSALDLLVQPADLGGGIEVLRRNGWRPPKAVDAGLRSVDAGVTLIGPSGPQVTLHDTADGVPGGVVVDPSELWGDAQHFNIGGRRLKALGSEQRLLYTSCRAAPGHPPSLLAQRDLAEMVLFGEWSKDRLMHVAGSWHAQPVLADAVRATWQRFAITDVTALSVWAAGFHSPLRERTPRGAAKETAASRPWRGLRGLLARR